MKIRFTKMQGAGNDFVVLDETQQLLKLSAAQYRFLADRRFGVGADQILSVRPGQGGADFEYVIHNADGGEVEQCGNGARCFARFVVDKGLTQKKRITVHTRAGLIAPEVQENGLVTVDMGQPIFTAAHIPFTPTGTARLQNGFECWPLDLGAAGQLEEAVYVAAVSMGNPHAVQVVADVDAAPVAQQGALIEQHPAFPRRVNAGFMQILSRSHIRLRVFERGAGETLACGTGACAAVVAGIRWGLLGSSVQVDTRGGQLQIEWAGMGQPVLMTGPAVTVFEGEITLPTLA
jgi:diaminopimelate epimerase